MSYPVTEYVGAFVSVNFLLLVVSIGALVSAGRARRRAGDPLERAVRWFLVGGMGVGATFIAISFWVVPHYMAHSMGYLHSPYQFEVSMTNIAFAVMAVLAVRHPAYRWVVVVGFAVFMWGALGGHVYQLLANGDDTPGNVPGIWFYDLVLPLVLVLLVRHQVRRGEAGVS